MTQSDLFPDARQDSPYIEFVRRHGIFTHRNDECPQPWLAMAFDAAKKWLESQYGAELSDEEESDPVQLIASYCALLECHDFIKESSTEREAVKELAVGLMLDGWEGVNWE